MIEQGKAAIFTEIYDKRHQSDYDDFMEFSIDAAKDLFPEVEELVNDVLSLVDIKTD